MKKINASAAILIGGESQRFGTDKAYLILQNDPISVHLFNMLNRIFSEVFFVSGVLKKDILKNTVVLPDLHKRIGPIGGLATALSYANYPFCYLTACDLPFITDTLIHMLWSQSKNFDIVVPTWSDYVEPLVAFYHKRCLDEVHMAIESGNYMLKGWWDKRKINYVNMLSSYSLSELKTVFFNINTPDDYQEALSILKNM